MQIKYMFIILSVCTAAIAKVMVFWVMTPCSLINKYKRFGEKYCLHRQGQNEQDEKTVNLYK
jgi:hypothetical protein